MTDRLFVVPAGLTSRQAHALEMIREHQPIRSDQLGAHLHAYRQQNGGRGHSAESFCDYCVSEARTVGNALDRKGLARYQVGKGWVLQDFDGPKEAASQLGPDDPFPEGF